MLDLSAHRQLVAQASGLRFQGKVVQVVGLSIEVEGLQLPLGEICHLYPERATAGASRITAEVVGFRDNRLILMPFAETHGVRPGTAVFPSGRGFAVPVGEEDVETFFLDVRGVAWDGSAGMKLSAPWDGCGMIATQSHAFAFEDFPVTRVAWPAESRKLAGITGPAGQEGFVRTCWAAITLGIVETALATARQQLARRRTSMRPFEQVEWTRVEMETWLIEQAYAGMLRAVEGPERPGQQTLIGKIAVAELAESALGRMCHVLGGGSYTHDSPFGYWLEDVRALGFLRPPWAFAYQVQFDGAWSDG